MHKGILNSTEVMRAFNNPKKAYSCAGKDYYTHCISPSPSFSLSLSPRDRAQAYVTSLPLSNMAQKAGH